MNFLISSLLLGASKLILAKSFNMCDTRHCLVNSDYEGRSPDFQIGLRIVPQVCGNLAGYYLSDEVRYVCFQAANGDLAYKFEYFARAGAPQNLYEDTCQTAMSSIMTNANGGPGLCSSKTSTGGGSFYDGDWRFTAYANPGLCAKSASIKL